MIRYIFLSITILTAVLTAYPVKFVHSHQYSEVKEYFAISTIVKDSSFSNETGLIIESLPISLNNPTFLSADFDADMKDELFIVDYELSNGLKLYKFYIGIKSDNDYTIADSGYSGVLRPIVYWDDEYKKNLIQIGYQEFDSINTTVEPQKICSPINVLAFDGEKAYSINEELYEIFYEANESLLSILNSLPSMKSDLCTNTKENLPYIFSIYINYLNAGEFSLAENFLRIYYKCDDFAKVRIYLKDLIN